MLFSLLLLLLLLVVVVVLVVVFVVMMTRSPPATGKSTINKQTNSTIYNKHTLILLCMMNIHIHNK